MPGRSANSRLQPRKPLVPWSIGLGLDGGNASQDVPVAGSLRAARLHMGVQPSVGEQRLQQSHAQLSASGVKVRPAERISSRASKGSTKQKLSFGVHQNAPTSFGLPSPPDAKLTVSPQLSSIASLQGPQSPDDGRNVAFSVHAYSPRTPRGGVPAYSEGGSPRGMG
ncbi:hypothetical protein T484DRAFT_1878743, partial [Baffinella frigidus]